MKALLFSVALAVVIALATGRVVMAAPSHGQGTAGHGGGAKAGSGRTAAGASRQGTTTRTTRPATRVRGSRRVDPFFDPLVNPFFSPFFFGPFGFGLDGLAYPSDSRADTADIPSDAPRPSTPAPSPEPSSVQPLRPVLPPRPAAPSASGNLRLQVEPSTAQAYVDGFYVGVVQDVDRSSAGLNLAAGWHRLEFRAPGYETLAVNVTVVANGTLDYLGNLKPVQR